MSAPQADICLLLEGTWPYVRGGVSSWVHQMLLGLPDVRFSVVFIGGERSAYPKRHYEVPPNVVHLQEVLVSDAWRYPARPDDTPPVGDRDALESLYRYFQHPETPSPEQGQQLLQQLAAGRITSAQLLRSEASWQVLSQGYLEHCSDPSFIDYFWTLRTMQAPLIMLTELLASLPRARAVHAVSTGYAGLLGALLKGYWQCPFILTEHGIYTKERKIDLAQAAWVAGKSEEAEISGLAASSGYIRTLWIRYFERAGLLAYQNADPIISLYEGNRARQIRDGAEAALTQVIPNGIALSDWQRVRAQRGEGIAPVAGLIGRVVPIKDVKTFLRAVRSVVSEIPEFEAWIVGPEDEDPGYAQECHSLVSSLGLTGQVHFLGFCNIREIMPQLGVMVLTSISEAQPLVILEAWCAGTPVVSTDVGSCRELIEGVGEQDRALGMAGEVVPIADPQATAMAIQRLLQDPERWHAAQRAGEQRVQQRYSDELMFARYSRLYRDAIGEG
ncbi:GT4 family glycosyltransferase PelF [Pseudomonas abyssi]|uniref:GT4 family glycosyltransferase PelF n=1 Tax=Pseudomonas abyssi TaxID=170540 RepID=UPI003C7AE1FE